MQFFCFKSCHLSYTFVNFFLISEIYSRWHTGYHTIWRRMPRPCMCVLGASEAKGGHQIWNWSHKWLWATVWVAAGPLHSGPVDEEVFLPTQSFLWHPDRITVTFSKLSAYFLCSALPVWYFSILGSKVCNLLLLVWIDLCSSQQGRVVLTLKQIMQCTLVID